MSDGALRAIAYQNGCVVLQFEAGYSLHLSSKIAAEFLRTAAADVEAHGEAHLKNHPLEPLFALLEEAKLKPVTTDASTAEEVVTVWKDGSWLVERRLDAANFSQNDPEWLVTIPLKQLSVTTNAHREIPITDEQIKHMVNRFLGWRLPDNFHPDDGISFEAEYNVEYNSAQGKPPARRQPSGTNLFDAAQAEAMVRYMIEGMPVK